MRDFSLELQIELVESKLKDEGILGASEPLKRILEDVKNNQITYVAIKELPQNFNITKSTEVFPGEIKYKHHEKI